MASTAAPTLSFSDATSTWGHPAAKRGDPDAVSPGSRMHLLDRLECPRAEPVFQARQRRPQGHERHVATDGPADQYFPRAPQAPR